MLSFTLPLSRPIFSSSRRRARAALQSPRRCNLQDKCNEGRHGARNSCLTILMLPSHGFRLQYSDVPSISTAFVYTESPRTSAARLHYLPICALARTLGGARLRLVAEVWLALAGRGGRLAGRSRAAASWPGTVPMGTNPYLGTRC